MENVQFEENRDISSFAASRQNKMSALSSFFVKLGLAKNESQAKLCMLLVTVVCLLLVAYINISTFAPDLLQFRQKQAVPVSADEFKQLVQQRTVGEGTMKNQ